MHIKIPLLQSVRVSRRAAMLKLSAQVTWFSLGSLVSQPPPVCTASNLAGSPLTLLTRRCLRCWQVKTCGAPFPRRLLQPKFPITDHDSLKKVVKMDLYSTYPRPNQEKSSEVKVAKYSVKYMRQSKSVAVLWGVFTFCAAILNIVVFISEEWVGATEVSKSPGHFGLWKYCIFLSR